MSDLALYEDQVDLFGRTRQAMRRHKGVLVQASTGSGKTVLSAAMIQSARTKGSRATFVVPRRELLRQTSETFTRFDIPHGIISAGYTPNPFAAVQIATSGTLARRLDKAPHSDVTFIDEAHFGGAELDRIIAHYKARGGWIIGLSATPWKMSGRGLGDTYDHMECGLPPADLIAAGRLSPYRMFAPGSPDLSGIATVAGDYAKGALSERMQQDKVLTGNAVAHYRDHAMGRLSVAFCTSVLHAQMVAQAFRDGGVPAAAISGEMDDDERARIIRAYARRELLVLTNCALLTFGFDLASAAQMDVTIECMSDLAPTQSLSLQMQKWGRVLRMKPFPALIFDHAGNVTRHGMPDDGREWSLAGRDVKQRQGEAVLPVRQCPTCYFCHRPAPVCPGCGFVYPVQSRMVDEVEGVLAEVTGRVMTARNEQGMAKGLDDLIRVGVQRGMANPHAWAAHVMTARMAKAAQGPVTAASIREKQRAANERYKASKQ